MSIYDPSDYKTGDAVPSNKAMDLNDNAKVFDVFQNSQIPSVKSRLGVAIKTIWQLGQEFDQNIENWNATFQAQFKYKYIKSFAEANSAGEKITDATRLNAYSVGVGENVEWYGLIQSTTIPSGGLPIPPAPDNNWYQVNSVKFENILPPIIGGARDTRFVMSPSAAAVRMGISDASPLDDQFNFFRGLPSQDSWGSQLNIGKGSAAFGRNGAAYAYLATTFGHDCSVYGVAGTAGGAGTCVGNPDDPDDGATFGYCGFAHGKNTIAKGRISHSIGETCESNSDHSETTGLECIAGPSDPSHPNYISSTGDYAISKGRRCSAFGTGAIALGSFATAYNGAHVIGSGINTGTKLINSNANTLALGRNVDTATLKLWGGNGSIGDFGKIGINTDDQPDDLIDLMMKPGDTVSVMSKSAGINPLLFQFGGKVQGANRGVFGIEWSHPNAGQPYGVTTLLQNETQSAKIDETGSWQFLKAIDLSGAGAKVSGVRVLGGQQAAIPNATAGTEVETINAILTALRNHGLIAT